MTLSKDYGQTKKTGSWLPIIAIILFILFLGMCCQIKQKRVEEAKKAEIKVEAPAINVVTMGMEPQIIRDRINLPGTLSPWVNVTVSTEVAGRVLNKTVTDGTTVKEGDLLGIIDSSKYQSAFNAAKASYESALTTKKRLEKLYRSELSNKSDLDVVTAQVENAQSSMQIASVDLEKCRIKAPVSGLVNRIFIEEGQFMDMGKPVVEIIQTNPIKVNVGIPESDVNEVRPLDSFDVKVDALGGKVFTARKNYLSRTSNSLARVYDLELIIDNSDGELLPDMFVRVEIVKKTLENALAVPLYSVMSADNKQFVYLAGKNPKHDILEAAFKALGMSLEAPLDTAYSRQVETGIQDGWLVEITQGLHEGDQVITVGQRSVSDGQKIHIIRTQSEQEELVR